VTGINDAVRMEWVRTASVRTTYLLVGTAAAAGVFIDVMIAALALSGPLTPSRTSAALTGGGDVMPVSVVGAVLAVLGAATVSHDYRFGLLPLVLTAQPRRVVAVAGRLVVLAAVAVGTAAVVSLLSAGACLALARPPSLDTTALRVVVWHAGLCVLWSWLGAALTWLTRSAGATTAVILIGTLFVEPSLTLAADQATPDARRAVLWLPFAAARQGLGRDLLAGPDTIGALCATAVFAATTACLLALAVLLVARRDA
jgi:ABC-2 type transport system permease protein